MSTNVRAKLMRILDALEESYGPQKLVGPENPYEMIVFLNSGYPASDDKAAREILDSGLPPTFEARQRAYLLLKKHGQETCKRSKPKCDVCPVTAHCAYLQAKAADANIE